MDEKRQEIESLGIEQTAGYKNLIAIKDYTRTTRTMFRDLEQENEMYRNQIKQFRLELDSLKEQIQQLRIQIYQNRATG